MDDKLYLPKRINVGYQTRNDTYTKKLGYVIYWDDKGKLRKETSWQGWRDKKIDPTAFDNVPTEGFILNRDVGGTRGSYSWDARMEKVRVWDPRDFEFEITVPNLLHILSHCTSTKGKGLEGKFVYAWDRTELILLAVDCPEYRASSTHTGRQAKKITKDDIVVGCSYTFKDGVEAIYLGRLPRYVNEEVLEPNLHYNTRPEGYYDRVNRKDPTVFIDRLMVGSKLKHVFRVQLANGIDYRFEDGYTKLAERNTETPTPDLAELIVEYQSSVFGGKMVTQDYEAVTIDFTDSGVWGEKRWNSRQLTDTNLYVKLHGWTSVYVSEVFDQNNPTGASKGFELREKTSYQYFFLPNGDWRRKNTYALQLQVGCGYYDRKLYSFEELSQLQFCRGYAVLENGSRVDLISYLEKRD